MIEVVHRLPEFDVERVRVAGNINEGSDDLSPEDSVADYDKNAENQVLGSRDTIVCGAKSCLLYTSPSPRDRQKSRMPSSA